jgi:hypothetical protein
VAWSSRSNDCRPVTWYRRTPIYITTIVAALYVLGIFATVILTSAGIDPIPFAFTPSAFLHGAIWQPLTCTFIQQPSFFSIFNIVFLYWAGVEVEKYLGQRQFLKFLALLLLVPPVVMMGWHVAGIEGSYSGNYELNIGVFIAFATLYPNVEWFGWVTLKWLAFAGIVLASMQYLPRHNWAYLSVLWAMCAAAFGHISFLQRGGIVAALPEQVVKIVKRKPRPRSLPASSGNISSTIDALLDKISRDGLKSLTQAERDKLERARMELLKKGA